MGKLTRVSDALDSTIDKLSKEIEEIQGKGLSPADYSLGFTNGLLFVQNALKGRTTHPKFYDRRTMIGNLPMPVKFKHETEEEAAEKKKTEEESLEYEAIVGQVISEARNVVDDHYAVLHNDLPAAINRLSQALDELRIFEKSKLTPSQNEETP